MYSQKDIIQELIDVLENDSTAVGRAGAAQGLHVAGGPEAFAALRKAMLKDSEGVVRGAAAAAVGFIIGRGHPLLDPLRVKVEKLEGKHLSTLNQQELSMLRMFMDQGHEQGVLVDFETDTDKLGWAELNSVCKLETLLVANSYVRLRFL